MTSARLQELAARYAKLRIAVIGDFCLDRYLEIDPQRAEISIETGLPVYNVGNVRSQPGAAGTILNNLIALGVGELIPVGFCGEDGEGYELLRALRSTPRVQLDFFLQTPLRRTFTYCKPLMVEAAGAPRELNRLDIKNWSPTPPEVNTRLCEALAALYQRTDAVILMDQVDEPDTGVITAALLQQVEQLARSSRSVPILADSRRGLRGFPSCIFKMNAAELAAVSGVASNAPVAEIMHAAAELARKNGQPAFVTLAERGIVGATAEGVAEHHPALPLRGPIDIVGAGDSVSANLAAAVAAGATLRESLQLAALASSVVIHQVGTSGAATIEQMMDLLGEQP
jgi:rfaE bifunctional protein kinase chain/domain